MVLCSLCLCAVTESNEADAAGIVFSCSVHERSYSPASSNEEGGIDSSCDDYELMITFQLVIYLRDKLKYI